jgi:hypothetical protein
MTRRLRLDAERLAEITPDDLATVAGAAGSQVLNCLLSIVLPHCVTDLCYRTTTV